MSRSWAESTRSTPSPKAHLASPDEQPPAHMLRAYRAEPGDRPQGSTGRDRRLATAEYPLHKGRLPGAMAAFGLGAAGHHLVDMLAAARPRRVAAPAACHLSTHRALRSEEHTSELQSRQYLVCRLLL